MRLHLLNVQHSTALGGCSIEVWKLVRGLAGASPALASSCGSGESSNPFGCALSS